MRPVTQGVTLFGQRYSPREAKAILNMLVRLRDKGPKTIDLRCRHEKVAKRVMLALAGCKLTGFIETEYLGDSEDPDVMLLGPFRVTITPCGLGALREDRL